MNQPKWDVRFLEMARLVSTWSRDPSTQTGAVIVRPDKGVVSVGFNGFAKPMEDREEWYNNREEKYSRIVHCEINALIQAQKSVEGCILYTYPFACCDRCTVQMAQAGIKRFVFPSPTVDALTRWSSAFEKTKQYMREMSLEWMEYNRTLWLGEKE